MPFGMGGVSDLALIHFLAFGGFAGYFIGSRFKGIF
jgi:hypothetical protein